MCPVDLPGVVEFGQQYAVQPVEDSDLVPPVQPPPAGLAGADPSSGGSCCQVTPVYSTNRMSCRHRRSSSGRGPGDRSGHGGSSGSVSTHTSSSTVHGLSPTPPRTHATPDTATSQESQDRVTDSKYFVRKPLSHSASSFSPPRTAPRSGVFDVEPGSVLDLRTARIHALPALYPAARDGLPILTDVGYTGTGIGVHTPFRPHPDVVSPLAADTRTHNCLLCSIRALGEQTAAELKQRAGAHSSASRSAPAASAPSPRQPSSSTTHGDERG